MTNNATKSTQKDTLNRGPYLDNLTKLITRLDKGVIAIDGEWGVGKTWLGASLKVKLDQVAKIKTIWLDLFEADWSDDPAISLIAGIAAQLDPEKSQAFLEKAGPILAAILPLAAKAAIKAAANYAGFDEETAKDWADAGKTETKTFIQKHLEDAREKQRNLSQLKELLNKTVTDSQGKIVIFADELDRCSPGYAVRFLERLKHLFDLEGVIYVLLWNREQIQKTVEVFYGAGSNGQMYLDKFIDIPLHLPISQSSNRDEPPLIDFIDDITPIVDGKERSGVEQHSLSENANFMADIAQILGLTARETKRFAAWWVMSPNRAFPVIDTWLLGLKVKHPEIFAGIRKGDGKSHAHALNLLKNAQLLLKKADSNQIQALIELHERTNNNTLDECSKDIARLLVGLGTRPSAAVSSSVRRLEFDFG